MLQGITTALTKQLESSPSMKMFILHKKSLNLQKNANRRKHNDLY